jgi:3-deoxy-D-manno-octulosonate 8-phosphate phosphatase (KDO 8-P phosphatase)
LFFFDDVLDLEVARQAGARIMVGRTAAPMLMHFAKGHAMVDYITGCNGHEHAVREGCELVIGLLNVYDSVVSERMVYSADYQRYLGERQDIVTAIAAGVPG